MSIKNSIELFACIHLGSERISMQIVEYSSLQDFIILEEAGRNVFLGEETYKTGKISFSTIHEVCELLKGFKRVMNEYGVRHYSLVATTAVREAKNRQYIVDQIYVKTGFAVKVLDMPQEIFYKYAALHRSAQAAGYLDHKDATLFVDTSSGGLGFILYKEGRIDYQQNIHIGAIRIKESFELYQRDSIHFHSALSEYIHSIVFPVRRDLARHKIRFLVLSGVEMKLFGNMLGYQPEDAMIPLRLEDFTTLYEQVKNLNLSQIMQRFSLDEDMAETVLPIIVLCKQILSLIEVEKVILVANKLIEGIVAVHIAEETHDDWRSSLRQQVVSFARALGEKYYYDADHSAQVEKNALLLFDRLVKVHGLGERDRLLLQVACILHDTGKHINLRRHYAYSYDLILSSDILGFSDNEKQIIATVAYYHSKFRPSLEDAHFAVLSDDQRIVTAKLAAILRIADAMDRSHHQKAGDHQITLKGDKLMIRVKSDEDMSLEEWTFEDKADFFEEVFGILPILQIQVR